MLLAAFVIGMVIFGALDSRFRAAPGSIGARTLGHRFGIRPSGPDGKYTRRERLRAAVASAFATCVCFAIAQLGAVIEPRVPDFTLGNTITEWMMFVGGLVGAVALLATVLHALAVPFAPAQSGPNAPDA